MRPLMWNDMSDDRGRGKTTMNQSDRGVAGLTEHEKERDERERWRGLGGSPTGRCCSRGRSSAV